MKCAIACVLSVAILSVPSKVFSLHDFEILNFAVKQVEKDSSGRALFKIAIDIRNNHQPGKIVAHVIALNKSGRVIKSQHMRGEFIANQVKTLSIRTFLNQEDYKDFDEWRLFNTIKYGRQ
ncbi:MAG: hypothetical protein JSV11_05015 [Nitrospiraceae bacterium]|nr:MAG: hypothetical protein JSV11_05015 [Nitrospiraceae bacterium]